jgi:hypothetical protein
MILQPKDNLERRQADRMLVLNDQRSKHGLRTAAAFYEAMAENVTEDPTLGRFAGDAATVLRRGYIDIAFKLRDLADMAERDELTHREILTGGVA